MFTFFNPITQTVSQLKTSPLTLTVKKGVVPKELQERVVLGAHQKRSWPIIPHYLMVIGAAGLVLVLLIAYLMMCYQSVIEKKITYYRFNRQVKKAHKSRDAQLLYQAWFVLLSSRLGVKKMVPSLYEIEHLFEQDVRLKWRYYIAELEKRAFQSRETIFDISDIVAQTYDWLDKIEDLL